MNECDENYMEEERQDNRNSDRESLDDDRNKQDFKVLFLLNFLCLYNVFSIVYLVIWHVSKEVCDNQHKQQIIPGIIVSASLSICCVIVNSLFMIYVGRINYRHRNSFDLMDFKKGFMVYIIIIPFLTMTQLLLNLHGFYAMNIDHIVGSLYLAISIAFGIYFLIIIRFILFYGRFRFRFLEEDPENKNIILYNKYNILIILFGLIGVGLFTFGNALTRNYQIAVVSVYRINYTIRGYKKDLITSEFFYAPIVLIASISCIYYTIVRSKDFLVPVSEEDASSIFSTYTKPMIVDIKLSSWTLITGMAFLCLNLALLAHGNQLELKKRMFINQMAMLINDISGIVMLLYLLMSIRTWKTNENKKRQVLHNFFIWSGLLGCFLMITINLLPGKENDENNDLTLKNSEIYAEIIYYILCTIFLDLSSKKVHTKEVPAVVDTYALFFLLHCCRCLFLLSRMYLTKKPMILTNLIIKLLSQDIWMTLWTEFHIYVSFYFFQKIVKWHNDD